MRGLVAIALVATFFFSVAGARAEEAKKDDEQGKAKKLYAEVAGKYSGTVAAEESKPSSGTAAKPGIRPSTS